MSTSRRAPKPEDRPVVGGMPRVVQNLAGHMQHLPGVGERTALRFAMHVATAGVGYPKALAAALEAVALRVVACATCNGLAEREGEGPHLCAICRDNKRDPNLLCVVARATDIMVVEKTGAMRGRYFVLGTLVSPLDGINLADLPLTGLLRAVARGAGNVEVLLALPSTVEGEATALALRRELASAPGVRVTAIARGVPHGGDLEFIDPVTLTRALSERAEVRT